MRRAIEDMPNVRFCVSPLVELECLVGPLRRGDSDLAAVFEQFFSLTVQLAISPAAYREAARLRAIHGLKTPDALHLATAVLHSCEQLWTNDNRLSKASGGMAVNVVDRQ